MRIWSMHPKYLDSKGLVALWRETLLAKNVLEGNTKGYTNHPQLQRYKDTSNTIGAINYYLQHIWIEATNRNYNFDKTKFEKIDSIEKIILTDGQLGYEVLHLKNKLFARDKLKYNQILNLTIYEPHPLFNLIEGDIEPWERI